VALAKIIKDQKKRNQIFGNVYAEIQFTKDLSLRNELSGNFDFNTEDRFSPTYTFGKGTVKALTSVPLTPAKIFIYVIRNFLTYNHNFNKLHIDALAGHESQESTFAKLRVPGEGIFLQTMCRPLMRGMLPRPQTRAIIHNQTPRAALHRNPGSAVSIFHGMTDTCSPAIYGTMVLQISQPVQSLGYYLFGWVCLEN
jgi:hypothetical protein